MRYHSLDFWRGVACIAVIFCHAVTHARETGGPIVKAMHWGQLGVPLFFVISGYCIAAAADNARKKKQHPGTYFWRRFKRIYPPYWIAFFGFAVIVGIVELAFPTFFTAEPAPIIRPWWLNGFQWFGNLTLTETWRHHVAGGDRWFFLAHAWTLCFEEQFYAIMGIAIALFPKRLFLVCALVTVGVVAVVATGRAQYVEGSFLDGRWLQFAAGIAVYCAVNYGKGPLYVLLLAGLAAWQRHVPEQVCAATFGALLILAHRFDNQFHASRLTAPLTWCGTMCYSIYLIHWPITKAISHGAWLGGLRSDAATLGITIPASLVASVFCGWLFHVWVERRFLNQPTSLSPS